MSTSTLAVVRDDCGYADFIRILTHDDRSSLYVLASRDEDGCWHERSVSAERLRGYDPTWWADAYVSVNGFSGRRRTAGTCRQVNALCFDLDAHNGGSTPAQVADAVMSAVKAGALPEPTMLVNSGRGVHLYYVLEKSIPFHLKPDGNIQPRRNEVALSFFEDIREDLATAIDAVVEPLPGVENDRAVFDFARVFRLPGTYNTKSRTYCNLAHSNEDCFYTLSSLKDLIPKPEMSSTVSSPENRSKCRCMKFDLVAMHRMGKLEELRNLRDHEPGGRGCAGYARNNMAFVYYNSAIQVHERSRAVELVRQFNAGFKAPLSPSEVDAAIRSVDANGPYKIGADKLARKFLRMTAEEIETVGFFSTRREIERQAAKERTRERRAKRDAEVRALLSQGLSQGKIAEIIGISRATVNKIAAAARREEDEKAPSRSLIKAARAALEQIQIAAITRVSNFLADVLGGVARPTSEYVGLRAPQRSRAHSKPCLRGPPLAATPNFAALNQPERIWHAIDLHHSGQRQGRSWQKHNSQ